MKKILKISLIVGVAGLLIALAVALYVYNKPHLDVAAEKPEFLVTAAQIYNEFVSDEDAANKKYLGKTNGKIIQVTGVVVSMNDKISITINEPTMVEGGINCSFDSTYVKNIVKLKVGDKVTVKGQCLGYIGLTNEVNLNKCILNE